MSRKVINVNVGVLGHVDSGKTHLVRVLSTHLSTAALDKNPQSQQRGITLDLGFSSFVLPRSLDTNSSDPDIQITLVDCPGHASLLKTILGGVHIIDTVLLVVDILKGLQPQTIECLVVAQLIVQKPIIILLNKIDLIPIKDRMDHIRRVESEISSFLQHHFPGLEGSEGQEKIALIPIAAAPGTSTDEQAVPIGISTLMDTINHSIRSHLPRRDDSGPMCIAVDHCFGISGNGTILTGTVLSGTVRVGQTIVIPTIQVKKPVKSMQMFKRSVQTASQGDRVALKVHGLDPSLIERTLVVSTDSPLDFVDQFIISVHHIPFFQSTCKSGTKIHVTIGHTTVLAVVTFLRSRIKDDKRIENINMYTYLKELQTSNATSESNELYALLQCEHAVLCPSQPIVVCSRLDLDPQKHHCRLAFYGTIHKRIVSTEPESQNKKEGAPLYPTLALSQLQIGSVKERTGVVDRVLATGELLGRDLFAKQVDWNIYINTVVLCLPTFRLGVILGPFGKSGKFRISLLTPESSNTTIPNASDLIIFRFFKLMKTRERTSASRPSSVKGNQKIHQGDLRILYPEAYQTSRIETSIVVEPVVQHVSSCGQIERLRGETTSDGRNPIAIVSGLYTSEKQALDAIGTSVVVMLNTSEREKGIINKPFGKVGKVRVSFEAIGGTRAQCGDCVMME